MNLGEIRAAVEIELQYAPELLAWRNDIRAVVNRVYQNLSRERKWPWLYRTEGFWALPDLTFPAGVFTLSSNPRTLLLDRLQLQLVLGLTNATKGSLTEYIQLQLEGAELDIASGIRTVGDGNWERAPFVIERTNLLGPDSPVAGVFQIALDPRCSILSINGTEGPMKISFPRMRLPRDCDSLETIRDDQGQPLVPLSPELARLYLRDRTIAAQNPSYILEDGGHEATMPRALIPVNTSGGVRFDASDFLAQRENWPVRQAFTLGAGAAGTIASGTAVRVFLSWNYAGRWGPPSPVGSLTVGGAGSVRVTGIPLLPQTSGLFEYGRRIGVFMAEGEGAFFFRGFQQSATLNTFDVLTSNDDVTAMDEGLRFARWDELYPGGPYQYVRLTPHPVGMKRYTVEYLGRPRQLVEDTDSPEFAEPFHNLVVWLACIEMCTRFGGGKVLPLFAANADRIQRQLETRYMPQVKNQGHQKGMIGQSTLARPTQTVDWHGDS